MFLVLTDYRGCRRAYIDALGEEPATYRSDMERLMKAAEGAGSVDALAAMPEVQVSEEQNRAKILRTFLAEGITGRRAAQRNACG